MKHFMKRPKSLQYDHLQGNPLDPANHPATSLPTPMGASSNTSQPLQPLGPTPSNALAFDTEGD